MERNSPSNQVPVAELVDRFSTIQSMVTGWPARALAGETVTLVGVKSAGKAKFTKVGVLEIKVALAVEPYCGSCKLSLARTIR